MNAVDADRVRAAFATGEAIVVTTRFDAALAPAIRTVLASDARAARAMDESLAAYALAGRVIEVCCAVDRAAIRIVKAASGKPLVRFTNSGAPAPSLSVTHGGGTVAVALCSQGEIGVDVERVRPVPLRLAERVLARDDLQRLLMLDYEERERAFAMLWTVAEACAKATGQGIRLLLSGMGRLGLGTSGTWNRLRWRAGVIQGHDDACAVAVDHARFASARLPVMAPVTTDWILGA